MPALGRPCETSIPPRTAVALFAAGLLALATACGGDGGGGGDEDTGCTDPILCPDLADADAADVTDEEPVGCAGDDECADDRWCDTESSTCRLGCRLSPDNCADPCAACDAEIRSCEVDPVCANACSSDDDCGSTTYCDLSHGDPGQCRTGCRPDAAECPDDSLGYCCNTGEVCDPDSHLCRTEPCETSFDCPALQFCFVPTDDPLGAECRDGCRASPDNCRAVFGGGPTTVCDPETRDCGEIDCGTDDALCPTGYVCDASLCRPGCRGDGDCATGQPCDPGTRLCGCATDDDCDELTVCVDESCIARCDANSDCRGATPYCNDLSGRCFGACANESGEPNNTATTATSVAGNTVIGVLCGVDTDWFRLTGVAGQTIRLTVAFDPGTLTLSGRYGAELTSVLFDPVTTASPDSIVQLDIDVTVATAGPIAIGFSGQGEAPLEGDALTLGYVAQIATFPTDSCQPDAREDDDTFVAAQAAPIGAGTYENLSLCADDAGGDWFAFTLPADTRASVSVDHDVVDGALSLDVLDTSLAIVASDSGVGTSLFAAAGPFPGGAATNLYIHVEGLDPDVDEVSSYTLVLGFDAVTACEPDALEAGAGNDSAAEATPSGAVLGTPVSFSDLTACSGDEDWFSLEALAGGRIDVALTQASTGRDTEIAILASNGTSVLASDVDNALEHTLSLPSLPNTDTYFVRIRDVGGSDAGSDGVGYDLDLTILAPVCTDPYEDDEPLDMATVVTFNGSGVFDTNTGDTPRACRADDDFWAFDMESSGTLTAQVEIQEPSAVRLDLIATAGESDVVVASGNVAGATLLRVPTLAVPAGSYAVRVSPSTTGFLPTAGRTYRLTITRTLEPATCDGGGLEPGGTLDDAIAVADGATGERICPGDLDAWLVTLPGPSAVLIDYTIRDLASCTPGAGAFLYDASGEALDLVDSAPVSSCSGSLQADFLDPGQALFVLGDDGASPPVPDIGFTYDFTVTRTPLEVCARPQNDSPASAAPLPTGAVEGRVCASFSNWYAVNLAGQVRHTFTLTGAPAALRVELSDFDAPDLPLLGQTTDGSGVAEIATSLFTGLHYVHVLPVGAVPLAGHQFTLTYGTETLSVCQADYLEPNDTPETAPRVGGLMDGDLALCAADADWFFFSVPLGGADTSVTLHQRDNVAPLALRVYERNGDGSAGAELDSVADANLTKTLTFADADALAEGDYLVEVAGGAPPVPEAGIPFALDVVFGAPACTDFLEPDDDGTQATAAPVDDVVTWTNLLACDANLDVFALDVAQDGTALTVTVDRAAPSAAMQLTLRLDGGGVVQSASGTAADSSFSLSAAALDAGRYLVEVSATAPGAAGERYTITLDSVAPFECTDAFEPDDTPAAASALPVPTASADARVCAAGAAGYDYFRLDPTRGPVRVAAQLDDPTGAPLTLTLRNGADAQLASGPSLVETGLPAPATYLLLVESSAPGARGAPYGLSVQTELFGCSADADEPNDAPAAGLPAPPGFGAVRYLCAEDDDYYRFTVPSAGLNVNVSVAHSPTDFDVRAELLRASDESLVDAVQDTLGFESFWVLGAAPGDYLIHLAHLVPGGVSPDHGVDYELAVTVSTESPCISDPFEPNDVPGAAERLLSAVAANACPGDADWYAFPVRSTVGDLEVSVTFTGGDAFSVALTDPSGETELVTAAGSTSPLVVSATDLPLGEYLVRVSADAPPEDGLGYEIAGTVTERGCLPDAFEPDDTLGEAASLTAAQANAAVCSVGDHDFYALSSQGSLSVEAATTAICAPTDPGCVEPTPATLEVQLYDAGQGLLPYPFDVDHAPGTLYAEVFTSSAPGELPEVGQPYQLNWLTGPPCADDAFETPGDSLADPAEGDALPNPADLVLCGADPDVFVYTTPAGGPTDVRAQVVVGDAAAGAVLELYTEEDLVTPVAVDAGASLPVLFARATGIAAGTDVFVVLHKDPVTADRVTYSLATSFDAACADDLHEPNEALADATTLATDTPETGVLCPGDVDLWETDLAAGGAFAADVQTGGAVLRVELFERVGDTLVELPETRVVTGSGRRVTAALDDAGTIVTRLSAADETVGYTLELDTTDACFPDGIDDIGSNETQVDADPWLAADEYALCPEGDEDWLSFVVDATSPGEGQGQLGYYVRAGVTVADPGAEFDLELRDSGGVLGNADETTPITGGFRFTSGPYLVNGTYFVRMSSARTPFLPIAYDVVIVETSDMP